MKKGQVTIFIIIGLALLIITGVAIYLFSSNPGQQPIEAPEVSKELKPLQNYVDQCIYSVGMKGIAELGRHGGYISLFNASYAPEGISYDFMKPAESDILFLDVNNPDSALPYWFYAKSRSGCWHCSLNTLTPSIDYMEYQIARYVESNIPECLGNYSTFKDKNIIINELSGINASAIIRDDDVLLYLNYTLELANANDNSRIEYFVQRLDIPLKRYYSLAINITQNQISNEFLDTFTFYMITQYGGLDTEKFPPFSAYVQDYTIVFWSKTAVMNKFIELLYSYLPMFNINGTSNYKTYSIPGNELETAFYNAMSLSMIQPKDYKLYKLNDLEVNFVYSGQPIYFDVRPSQGDLIRPETTTPGGGLMSSVLPENNYKFYYDISYPVIVEIRDASRDDNYIFMFALQSNIKENKFISDWLTGQGTIPWSNDIVRVNINDPSAGKKLYDTYTGKNYTYQPPKNDFKTMFCDEQQRQSGNIKVKTYDFYTQKPLDDVQVIYGCGHYASCFIGPTAFNATSGLSSLSARMPLCNNGYLLLVKGGYLDERIPLTTQQNVNKDIGSVYMYRIASKNISVRKYYVYREIKNKNIGSFSIPYFTGRYLLSNITYPLSADDTVIVTMKKDTYGVLDTPHVQTKIFSNESLSINQTIDLVPGRYSIEAQLLDNAGVIIYKECKEICWPSGFLGLAEDCKKIPENNIELKPAVWGGIEFKNQSAFTLSNAELSNNNTLEFYVIRMPNPRCLDDMQETSYISAISGQYRNKLIPRFKQ